MPLRLVRSCNWICAIAVVFLSLAAHSNGDLFLLTHTMSMLTWWVLGLFGVVMATCLVVYGGAWDRVAAIATIVIYVLVFFPVAAGYLL